jgi:Ser/Thr protein kinase RdoA (MazF antagonist)
MSGRAPRHRPEDRPGLDDPQVRRLAAEIAPGARATDLGGTMSLNARLEGAGLVLRVHRPLFSRARLLALQRVRRGLAGKALVVPAPIPWRGATLFRCGNRWAELEAFVASERLPPTTDAYTWLFGALGALHRGLASPEVAGLAVPRPAVSTYGPPATLRRWLPATEAAVRHDRQAAATARWLHRLVGQLRAQWVPATALPVQLIHGDARLGNFCRTPEGEAVYFDFGFLARRPRVHDLAYALAWIVLRPDSRGTAEGFAWDTVPRLVGAYEVAAETTLTTAERRALVPYTAAVPLYLAALAGEVGDPVAHLRNETRLTFLRIGEWLLDHPEAVLAGRTAAP